MAFVMGSTMAVLMLSFMVARLESKVVNAAILSTSVVIFALTLGLVRSQVTVQDQSDFWAMIPHRAIALLAANART